MSYHCPAAFAQPLLWESFELSFALIFVVTKMELIKELKEDFGDYDPKKMMTARRVFKGPYNEKTSWTQNEDMKKDKQRVSELVDEDGCLILTRIAMKLKVHRETGRRILKQDLWYSKKSARWMTRFLTNEQ